MSNTKRILHLIESSEPGGAESIYSYIIRSLNPENYQSIAAISGNGAWLTNLLSDLSIKTLALRRTKPLDATFLLHIIKCIRAEKIDLIHSHMFTMNLYAALASLYTRTPHICTMHDTCYDLATPKRVALYKLVSKISKALVTVSPSMEAEVRQKISNSQKVRCIPNGIQVPSKSLSSKQALRTLQGVSPEQLIILNVGNLYPVKNQLLLVDLVELLTAHVDNFSLLIIGEGPLRHSLQSRIERRALQDRITLLGIRDDVSYWLSIADLFILPSASEGLSISLLEAMGHQLPVIASSAGGNSDILNHKENGILVDNQNAHAYLEAVLELYKNKALRQRLGANALEAVENVYNVNLMTENYTRLYAECAT